MKKTLLILAALVIAAVSSNVFANTNEKSEVVIDWTQVDEIWEWGLHLNMIYIDDIVIFDGAMYQCIGESQPGDGGTFAYSYMWNPTAWEAPRYQEVAPVAAWKEGAVLAAGDYVTYGDALYRSLSAITASAAPDASADYERLAGVTWGPEIVFPANYVAYWDDYNSWQPGFIIIYEEQVYKCIKATTVMANQLPGAEGSEYWSASLGSIADILSIEGVTIPDWDDTRIWIVGSVVTHEGKYYKAKSQTHLGENEYPGGTGGYWEEVEFATNALPANFVGYWSDDMIWKPGYHAIYNGQVYECISETHKGGGENPETIWGFWNNTSKGAEADLLTIGITIPAWSDDNWWPAGAVVVYNDKYYKCLAQTHVGGGEHPETTWGYWAPLELPNGLNEIPAESLKYYVSNGQLVVDSHSADISIELYSITGQSLATAYANYIDLPQTGLYIARVTIDGQSSAIKLSR